MSTDIDRIPPEHLYKYRGPLPPEGHPQFEWHREPIMDSVLFFAPPTSLNDLFDCMPCWDCDASPAEIKAYVQSAVDRNTRGQSKAEREESIRRVCDRAASAEFWQASWLKQVDKFGVFSLSEVPNHTLMWAHYGGNHKGYCLEINRLDVDITKEYIDLLPLEVTYSGERPHTRTSAWLQDMTRGTTQRKLFDLVCHKDKSWEYEREWRLFGKHRKVHFPPEFLSAIILGARCSPEDEKLLRRWARDRQPTLEFRRIISSPTDFILRIETLDA